MGKKCSSVRPLSVCLCLVVAIVFISGASISRSPHDDQSRATIRQVGQPETIIQQAEHSESGDSTTQAVVAARLDQSGPPSDGRKRTASAEKRSTEIQGMKSAVDDLNIMIRCVNLRRLLSGAKRTGIGLQPLCNVFISPGPASVKEDGRKQTEKHEQSDEDLDNSPNGKVDVPAKRQQTILVRDGRKRIKPLEHFVRKHFLVRHTISATNNTSTTPPRILEKDLHSLMPSITSSSVNSAFFSETRKTNSATQDKQTPDSFASEKTDAMQSSQTPSGFQNIYVLKKHVRKTFPVF